MIPSQHGKQLENKVSHTANLEDKEIKDDKNNVKVRCDIENCQDIVLYKNLARHKKRKHQEQYSISRNVGKKFCCQNCKKLFTRQWTLDRHVLSHSNKMLRSDNIFKEIKIATTACSPQDSKTMVNPNVASKIKLNSNPYERRKDDNIDVDISYENQSSNRQCTIDSLQVLVSGRDSMVLKDLQRQVHTLPHSIIDLKTIYNTVTFNLDNIPQREYEQRQFRNSGCPRLVYVPRKEKYKKYGIAEGHFLTCITDNWLTWQQRQIRQCYDADGPHCPHLKSDLNEGVDFDYKKAFIVAYCESLALANALKTYLRPHVAVTNRISKQLPANFKFDQRSDSEILRNLPAIRKIQQTNVGY